MRRAVSLLIVLPFLLPGQSSWPEMTPAMKEQLASVRRQAGVEKAEQGSFFLFAWPRPIAEEEAESAARDCRRLTPAEVDEAIEEAAKREGFTPDLLRAVIGKESGYRPCAISSKGARGLMQLMPDTAWELGVTDPLDPEENIEAGARYLGQMLARYDGKLDLALSAYNAGPAKVDQYQGIPPIPETIDYVKGILGSLQAKP